MENRKIAIITINYNTESLIERFIDSIVSQTYKNWLIAIANNSDSDKILNRVIQKYSEIEIYVAVSYTHLDVYKRQCYNFAFGFTYRLTDFFV